jgi:hypothetical protein
MCLRHALPSLIARAYSGFPMQISSWLSRPAPRVIPNRQKAIFCCLASHKITLRHFIQSPVDIHQEKGRCFYEDNYVRGCTDTTYCNPEYNRITSSVSPGINFSKYLSNSQCCRVTENSGRLSRQPCKCECRSSQSGYADYVLCIDQNLRFVPAVGQAIMTGRYR